MIQTPKPHRVVPILLTVCALFFIIRQPAQAAVAATNAFHGLTVVTDALMTFASNLG
ncbi:hypothetical protein ABGB17_02650 [Sphaerisporangium sp. B11E5]|uniref:hypothetical protein n=1 Tax=Sphaerisporangium sp. B11E5 TaxID=3153563 RepID=UPI00325DC81C